MKLYTEEQVRKGLTTKNNIIPVDLFLEKMTPIELPSEEEIKQDWGSDVHLYFVDGFEAGAKWVIEQIKQQGNGKSIV